MTSPLWTDPPDRKGRGIPRPFRRGRTTPHVGSTLSSIGSAAPKVNGQGAGGGTRTLTGLRPARCRRAASASSATPAPSSSTHRPLVDYDAARQRAMLLAKSKMGVQARTKLTETMRMLAKSRRRHRCFSRFLSKLSGAGLATAYGPLRNYCRRTRTPSRTQENPWPT